MEQGLGQPASLRFGKIAGLEARLKQAIGAAQRFLFSKQDEAGWWCGELECDTTLESDYIFLHTVLGTRDERRFRQCAEEILRKQNADGGWGEDLRSYPDTGWMGRGSSTPSQTAWTIMALIAAGEANGSEVTNGVTYLLKRQRADGTWDEKEFTGTGFPKYFYLGYHNYRNCFPLMALGRYLSALGNEATPR